MPLLIADTDGSVLYKSLSLSEAGVKKMFCAAMAADKRNGLFTVNGHNLLAKEMLICGKQLVFFANIEDESEEELLKWAFSKESSKTELSLTAFTKAFASTYAEPLRKRGILLSLRLLAIDASIVAHAGMLMLCLSLMVRILVTDGARITLSATETDGSVIFFADSQSRIADDMPFLWNMLSALSAEEGFSPSLTASEEHSTVSLRLSPVDISRYGFKDETPVWLKRLLRLCADMFL